MEVHTVLSKMEKERPRVLNSAGIFFFHASSVTEVDFSLCFYKGPYDKLIHVLKCQNRMRCV
jgi:hypothetical protein